jgi:hypothetical protein
MEIVFNIIHDNSMTSIITALDQIIMLVTRSKYVQYQLTAQRAQISASAQRISDSLPLPSSPH